jgi:hypothetical protein
LPWGGQVIEYSCRPLYDGAIPLETFLTARQAVAFRGALKNASLAAWADAGRCLRDCRSSTMGIGYCVPAVNRHNSSLTYSCVLPGQLLEEPRRLPDTPAFEIERKPLGLGDAPVVPGLAFLQLGVNSFLGLPPHEQYGTHMRNRSEFQHRTA